MPNTASPAGRCCLVCEDHLIKRTFKGYRKYDCRRPTVGLCTKDQKKIIRDPRLPTKVLRFLPQNVSISWALGKFTCLSYIYSPAKNTVSCEKSSGTGPYNTLSETANTEKDGGNMPSFPSSPVMKFDPSNRIANTEDVLDLATAVTQSLPLLPEPSAWQ